MTDERVITTRRTIQQIVHCAEEALGVIEREEDIRCAIDDLNQARELIDTALRKIRDQRDTERGRIARKE